MYSVTGSTDPYQGRPAPMVVCRGVLAAIASRITSGMGTYRLFDFFFIGQRTGVIGDPAGIVVSATLLPPALHRDLARANGDVGVVVVLRIFRRHLDQRALDDQRD